MPNNFYRVFVEFDAWIDRRCDWLESKRLKFRGKAIGYESLLPSVLGLLSVAVWFGVSDLDARRVCQEAANPHACHTEIGAHVFYFTGLPWLLIVVYSAALRSTRRMAG